MPKPHSLQHSPPYQLYYDLADGDSPFVPLMIRNKQTGQVDLVCSVLRKNANEDTLAIARLCVAAGMRLHSI